MSGVGERYSYDRNNLLEPRLSDSFKVTLYDWDEIMIKIYCYG